MYNYQVTYFKGVLSRYKISPCCLSLAAVFILKVNPLDPFAILGCGLAGSY